MLKDMIGDFYGQIQNHSETLAHNHKLFDIYEGQLLPQVLCDLKEQLSPGSYEAIKTRVAPINVLKRIVDKLSKIYMQSPTRRVEGGNDQDKELLGWFEDCLKIDRRMNTANEFFNLFKNCLLQPVLDESTGTPLLRVIPSDRFLPFSTNRIDPTKPTNILTFEGKAKATNGSGQVDVYGAYSADEWLMFDSNKEVRQDLMGGSDGVNPYEVLPFVYVNRSENLLIPKPDSDTLTMTKIIPILLSDLNYAVLFQAFSVLYTIDCDTANAVMAPNSLWNLHSLGDGEKKPEIGSIKPQVDILEVMQLIQSQMSLWLQTRGIRPGSVGQLTQENATSGISKIVDEMDTSEDRKKQVNWFKQAETELWDLLLKQMHPVWAARGLVEQRYTFTRSAYVDVDFPEQLPLTDRSQLVSTLQSEVAAGFTTKKRAIEKLNPGLDDEMVDELMVEIETERYGAVDAPELDANGEPISDSAATQSVGGQGIGADVVTAQKIALNGAQVSSMIEIITAVAAGSIPRSTGVMAIQIAFALDAETAEQLMGETGKSFAPTVVVPVAPPAGAVQA